MSEHHPTNRERLHALLDLLGYLYMVYGKPKRATEYLRLLIRLRPSDSRLMRALGKSELEAGNPEAARGILEDSLNMNMSSQERAATFLLLSRVLLRLEQLEDSTIAITEFMKERGVIS